MAETNQLLINYYKKEEMKKVKKMMEEKLEVGEILKSVNMEWISKEEVLNILGEDYEPVIKDSRVEHKHKNENIINTFSVTPNTPMEIAKNIRNILKNITKIEKKFAKIKILAMEHFKNT